MKLASIFTDHMVLQANQPVRVFGEGKGKIKVSFLGETVEYVSDDEQWCVELKERQYGGPYEMEIVLNDETILLKDIYVGEVWMCAGQSNMELVLYRTVYGVDEAKHAYNEKIRFITIPRRVEKNTPLYGWYSDKRTGEDVPWEICEEESALHFSAIGYYVAKELQEKLQCAVGVINCSWGGRAIEPFIRKELFYELDCLKPIIEKYNKMMEDINWDEYLEKYNNAIKGREEFYNALDYDEVEEVRQKGVRATAGMPHIPVPLLPEGGPYHQSNPGCLYETMLSRFIPFSIAGVMWYQGESNLAPGYADKYLLLMKSLREDFKHKNMPFYAVELASFSNYWSKDAQKVENRFDLDAGNWAFMREEQQKATELDDNNYLVTSMGLGDLYDIHPIHKQELSHRMALKILKHTYGFDIYADQPVFKNAIFEDSKVVIELDNADGLYSRLPIEGVNILVADESKQLKRAKVLIENDSLILTCDEVESIVYVRYGYDYNYSGCHIFNKGGLPLAPFGCDKNNTKA